MHETAEKMQKAPNRKISNGFETVKRTTRNSNVKNKQQTKVSRPEKQKTGYVSEPYYRNEKQKIRNERELRKCNTHNRVYIDTKIVAQCSTVLKDTYFTKTGQPTLEKE